MITDDVVIVLCPNYSGLGHITRLVAIGREFQMYEYPVILLIPEYLRCMIAFTNLWNLPTLVYSTKQVLFKILEKYKNKRIVIIEDYHPYRVDLESIADIFVSIIQTTHYQYFEEFRNADFLVITHPFSNENADTLCDLPLFLFEIPHETVPPILNPHYSNLNQKIKEKCKKVDTGDKKLLFAVAGGGHFGNLLAELLNESLSIVFQTYHDSFEAVYMIGPQAAFYDLSALTNLKIIPATPSIFEYSKNADLVVSQSGFQSFNEVVVSNVPAIFFPRNLEQLRNLEFSQIHHFSITSFDPEKLANLICELFEKKIKISPRYTQKDIDRGRQEAVKKLKLFIEKKF